jgi:hypothetical protein
MLASGEDPRMGRQTVVFDPEAFVRTASLFESKREGILLQRGTPPN